MHITCSLKLQSVPKEQKQSLNVQFHYSVALSLLFIRSLCLRSFKCIHNAHALNTTTVRSTDTIQYKANPPMGRSRLGQLITGMEKIVCSGQLCCKQKRHVNSWLTAMNVPGRNTVVKSASAFIAAPSFIPAAAMRRPEMASRVVMKLYTYGLFSSEPFLSGFYAFLVNIPTAAASAL